MPPDKIVSVPTEAVGVEGSSAYLSAGELLSVRELLLALLLESANDAAVALAIATAGSLPAFAELMNEKAAELGLEDTHFTNPHGLYDEEHYTTARELAIITAEALNSDELREIFATKSATIPLGAKKGGDEREGKRYLRNHNKMLSLYEGAIGVKTGFTKKTGRCLVSAAERDGMTLICVTLGAPDDWNDHTALLDHGFDSYSRVTLYEKGELRIPYALTGGSEQYVTATNSEPLTMTLPKGFEIDQAALNSEFPHHFEFAPVEAGALLGRVTVSLEGRQISSPLVAAYGVPSAKRREHKRFIFF
jgi:D-alanyl-D-alanine carboxypeptidase